MHSGPEDMAGHADLTTAARAKHRLIQPGPVLDLLFAGGLRTREQDRHLDDNCMRTPALAAFGLAGCFQGVLPGPVKGAQPYFVT